MVMGSTQPLTEMSTRNLPGGKGRPERKSDSLTAIFERLSRKCGILDVSQPYGPALHATGTALPFLPFYLSKYVQLSFSSRIVTGSFG
jgi:hypothetical protein